MAGRSDATMKVRESRRRFVEAMDGVLPAACVRRYPLQAAGAAAVPGFLSRRCLDAGATAEFAAILSAVARSP